MSTYRRPHVEIDLPVASPEPNGATSTPKKIVPIDFNDDQNDLDAKMKFMPRTVADGPMPSPFNAKDERPYVRCAVMVLEYDHKNGGFAPGGNVLVALSKRHSATGSSDWWHLPGQVLPWNHEKKAWGKVEVEDLTDFGVEVEPYKVLLDPDHDQWEDCIGVITESKPRYYLAATTSRGFAGLEKSSWKQVKGWGGLKAAELMRRKHYKGRQTRLFLMKIRHAQEVLRFKAEQQALGHLRLLMTLSGGQKIFDT